MTDHCASGQDAWLPLLSIRIDEASESSTVSISDPLFGRRARVDRAALIEVLAWQREHEKHPLSADASRLLTELRAHHWLDPSNRSGCAPSLSAWWDYGWHPSLEYYLWSRHARYVDS